jgi:hypothetical protein
LGGVGEEMVVVMKEDEKGVFKAKAINEVDAGRDRASPEEVRYDDDDEEEEVMTDVDNGGGIGGGRRMSRKVVCRGGQE